MNIIILLFTLLPLLPSSPDNTKIFEWRGKDRSGIYQESNLLKSWPEEGPNEIWATEDVGNGFVSPIFTDNRFYITGEIDSMAILFCFNLKGEKQWQTTLGREWMKSHPGSRSIPTIVDDLIYVGSGLGNLYCLNKERGKTILVTFSSYHLMGFDTKDGKLLWSHEQDNYPPGKRAPGYGDTHCNTVLYDNGSIYYAAGDGNCGVKLSLSEDGNSINEEWRNKGFDSYMGGIVKIGGYLYGSGTVKTELKAINANSGELTDSLKVGSGAIIAADNMLYYYTQKGDLMLLSYNQGKVEKISSFRIKKGTQQHFSHPVINKGVLYQRHGKVLMAFDIRKKD